MEQHEINEALADMGITMESEFIPWSKRPRDLWTDVKEGIAWSCTIKREGKPDIVTPYMLGIGHLPAAFRKAIKQTYTRRTIWQVRHIKAMIEKGIAKVDGHVYKVTPPQLADVIYSLVTDGAAWFDGQVFEEWAADYGYDEDSRPAERVFEACRQLGIQVSRMFTPQEVEILRELFSEY